MKCPYCRKEMIVGEIRSQQGSMIYWQPFTEDFFKSRISKSSIIKHEGIVLADAQSILSESTQGYVCKNCNKCIITFQ